MAVDVRVTAKHPPERNAFVHPLEVGIKLLATAADQLPADWHVDYTHACYFVRHGFQASSDVGEQRKIACLVQVFHLLEVHEEIVQAVQADRRAAVEGKRVLLKLAHKIEKPKPDGIGLHPAGFTAGPVAA